MPSRLTREHLLQGVAELSARDRGLAAITAAHGPPPMWGRRPGFPALLKIILEQQVSLKSAEALYRRLQARIPEISPAEVHSLSEKGLRKLGFTRQKAAYCSGLARMILDGELELGRLGRMSDDEAHATLLGIKGIGPWTANIYLLMALRRPDIWPDGDLALAESARRIRRLKQRPSDVTLRRMARRWRPWRSVAARMLWHAYLCEQKSA